MKPTFQTNPYYRLICFLLGAILLYVFVNYHTDKLFDYYIAVFVSLSFVAILLFQSIYIEEFIFQNDKVVYQRRYFIWVKIILIIPYREIQRIEKIENIQRITNYKIYYIQESNIKIYSLTTYKLLLYYLIRPNFDYIFEQISVKANKPIEYRMI